MTRPFQKEIDKLKKRVLQLTVMVEESLQMAVKSVTDRESGLAEDVIRRDTEIDQMEVELEEECLKILALHQPVAIDLRFIIAALKINSDLERIGDLAVNIAKCLPHLASVGETRVPFDLPAMQELAVKMVKMSIDSLVNLDVDLAEQVCKSDDQMDHLYREAYEAVELHTKQQPDLAGYYLNLLLISRNLERIGDHSTNISEDVIYMVDGEIVRHKGGL